MGAKAYVLIETWAGKNRDVCQAIRAVKGVSSADTVTGTYDVIAILEASSLGEIGDIVLRHIQPTGGVSRTVTCLSLDVT